MYTEGTAWPIKALGLYLGIKCMVLSAHMCTVDAYIWLVGWIHKEEQWACFKCSCLFTNRNVWSRSGEWLPKNVCWLWRVTRSGQMIHLVKIDLLGDRRRNCTLVPESPVVSQPSKDSSREACVPAQWSTLRWDVYPACPCWGSPPSVGFGEQFQWVPTISAQAKGLEEAVQNEADRRTSSATLNLHKGYDPAREVKNQKRSEL